jgi:16S rRNA (guanine527-N7)-methyltransferase
VTLDPDAAEELRGVLLGAQDVGFLGSDDPQRHIDHAAAFVAAAQDEFGPGGPETFVDLGTGAGIPGLVLALCWPDARAVLVDAQRRRCAFVTAARSRLGLDRRVEVVCDRAEALGRSARRGTFPLVVARSLGPPAVTVELAAPLSRPGAITIVSEPPGVDTARWPAAGLAELGLVAEHRRTFAGASVQVLRCVQATPDRYPRRVGVPSKRPLW